MMEILTVGSKFWLLCRTSLGDANYEFVIKPGPNPINGLHAFEYKSFLKSNLFTSIDKLKWKQAWADWIGYTNDLNYFK